MAIGHPGVRGQLVHMHAAAGRLDVTARAPIPFRLPTACHVTGSYRLSQERRTYGTVTHSTAQVSARLKLLQQQVTIKLCY